MPIPLFERASRGFEKGKFFGDLQCRFSSESCEEIAALFYLRINRRFWRASLDRVEVVG
jgi:hypothetical protein